MARVEANAFAIETAGVTKRYAKGRAPAVDTLCLRVRHGEVYGLLGPNGAGKTTALRMLVGLMRPSAGSVSVLGRVPGSRGSLDRVGAMIEAPDFYPFLSGRENLRVMAAHAGVAPARVEAVLELTDLASRAGDRFGTYSMGMKQRLGLAAALLKDPELLILDEPTTGLDPAGIAEMRSLLRRLGSGSRTVLLSSHLMTEVEQTCDRVGIIRRGRLVAEGTIEELRGEPTLHVRACPIERAAELIGCMVGAGGFTRGDGALEVHVDPSRAAEINRELVRRGVEISELTPVRSSLEDVFLNLVAEREEGHGKPAR